MRKSVGIAWLKRVDGGGVRVGMGCGLGTPTCVGQHVNTHTTGEHRCVVGKRKVAWKEKSGVVKRKVWEGARAKGKKEGEREREEEMGK